MLDLLVHMAAVMSVCVCIYMLDMLTATFIRSQTCMSTSSITSLQNEWDDVVLSRVPPL